MNKISKVMKRLRQLILKILLKLKLPLKAVVKFGNKQIIFHDVVHSSITENILLHGAYGHEYEFAQLVKNFPGEFKTFIDGGANIGFYSALAESFHKDYASIIAVEACPNNIAYLEELKRKNGFTFQIIDRAIAEKPDLDLEFFLPTSHRSAKYPPAASLINSFKGSGRVFDNTDFETIVVKTCSLIDIIENNEGPYFIKLDIEGYELPVLKSAEEILKKRNDINLVVEIMINDEDKKEIFSFLGMCGYSGYLITNAGLVKEDRPLTLPYHYMKIGQQRTCWKNHFFTKQPEQEIEKLSKDIYGYYL